MEKPVNSKYPPVRTITDSQRIGMVKEIFSTITDKYDFLNHFLSLRRDIAWRRFTVKKMRFGQTNRFLDVACGTGDLAVEAAHKNRDVTATGTDFVIEMVRAAGRKARKNGLSERLSCCQGDGTNLPFGDNTFDVAAIAFGIRNIPDRMAALKEMLRVVVPGGQVMILEMTFVQNRFFKLIYFVYLNYLLPLFAKVFSSNPAAYHYLADSIMNFPSPAAFARMMEEAGMVEVEKHSLTLGITYLHIGRKMRDMSK